MKNFLDLSVKTAVITLISSIVDNKSCIEEVDKLIQTNIINELNKYNNNNRNNNKVDSMNLINYFIKLVGNLDQPASVRIEGWGILCAFARTHFSIIR